VACRSFWVHKVFFSVQFSLILLKAKGSKTATYICVKYVTLHRLLYFCLYLCQMLTDFPTSFDLRLCCKLVIESLMKIPAHSNCVATLPCKICGTFTHSGRFLIFGTPCAYMHANICWKSWVFLVRYYGWRQPHLLVVSMLLTMFVS